MEIKRYDTNPRMSMAVVHGDTIYLAGQTADDTSQDMAGQTRQVLAKIEAMLSKVGSDKSKILTASVYVSDMSLFNQMNKVWDDWVEPDHTPARCTVEAKISTPQKLVEIICIAAR